MRILFSPKIASSTCTETLLALLCILPLIACEPSKKSACEGFSERTFAITREEYRPCAGEIMGALDSVRTNLKAGLAGDKKALSQARSASRELDTLLYKIGLPVSILTVAMPQSNERWPDGAVQNLNDYIKLTTILYKQCLSRPNQLEFDRGEEAHEEALHIYRSLY